MAKQLAKVRVQIIDADTKLPKEDVDVITSADCVYFPDGKTFQQKWEDGEFQGEPGEDGAAATVRVGSTTTVNSDSRASVENVGTRTAAVLNFTIPRGEKGDPGTSIKIIARFNTYEELVAMYPDGSDIDGGFLVGPEHGPCEYYFWDHEVDKWVSMGPIRGPQGEIGDKGDPGDDVRGLAILTSVTSYAKLIELYPDGSVLDGWGIITNDTKEYWYWDHIQLMWKSAGCILGLKGDQGDPGQSATIKVGTVTTSEPGTEASVTNIGDSLNAVLDFVIPRGSTGEKGADAEVTIDHEISEGSLNPVSGAAVYNELLKYALQSHEHLYAGSSNPGGAANSALQCTGNSATATRATNDADGNDITKTYVNKISVDSKNINFLSKDGDVLFTLDKSNTYNLPTATENTLGGVKVDNDTISISNGSIYVKGNYLKDGDVSLKLWSAYSGGYAGTYGHNNGDTITFTPTISGIALIYWHCENDGYRDTSDLSARYVTANSTITLTCREIGATYYTCIVIGID